MTAMNSDSKSPELRLTEYFKLACVRHRGYTLPPKLYVSAYVMDQGGGLCPSDIWAPKSETSETPVVGGLEALTGSISPEVGKLQPAGQIQPNACFCTDHELMIFTF